MEEWILIKKRGFTLIEVVAVIGILAVLMAIGFPYVYSLNKVKEDTKDEILLISIDDLLKNSKEYCLRNRKGGVIRFDNTNKRGALLIDEISVYEIHYEGKYEVYFKRGTVKGDIKVSNKGRLDSGSIFIIKNGIENNKITIGVGVDYIEIK